MTDTIATVADAESMLADLRTRYEEVDVFWDRGWGDSGQTADISIVVDGNGNEPHAKLTADVYRDLVADGIVEKNAYVGFKKRRWHAYRPAPVPEKTGPTSNDVIEEVLRGLFAAHPDLP
ncbi:MAG TPA: hypothetical protein VI172_08105, partial [Candidatus Dormibacteraeota bacterium]